MNVVAGLIGIGLVFTVVIVTIKWASRDFNEDDEEW